MAPARPAIRIRRLISLASLVSFAAITAAGPSPTPSADDSGGTPLPTLSFRADGAGSELFDALRASRLLANLSKDAPGSPIQLRVFHTVQPAHLDAKNFFSGLAAIGTLGLAPVVMTGKHTMHYELYVNGERILRREYSMNLSRKEYLNSRAVDATHGLGSDGEVWAKSTVDLFLADLAHDGAVRALSGEYRYYFDEGSPGTVAAAKSTP